MEEYLIQTPVATVIFVITILTSVLAFSNENLFNNLILHPYTVSRRQRIYTVITSGLIHGDWMHLGFNMFSFYFFAFPLEKAMGHWQFGLLYVASLMLSDLPTVQKYRDDYGYRCLGASGAVSAVIFGFILYHPDVSFIILPLPIGIPALLFGPLYLVYCHYSAKYGRDNINHDAHLFGALSGLLITVFLNPHVINSFITGVKGVVQHYLHQ